MSDRRYTVTEGQLRIFGEDSARYGWYHGNEMAEEFQSGRDVWLKKRISTLTPDPEPSGEVVERWDFELTYSTPASTTTQHGPIVVEVRGPGKSLVYGSGAVAVKRKNGRFVLAKDLTSEVTRQVEERTKGYREALEFIADRNDTPIVQKTVAQQALANKGGSDD